jgi:glycosyltransferase involved in cell wall biosynthesis
MIVSDLWPESVRELGIIGDGAAYSFSRWLEMFAYRRAWRIAGVTERICESIAARVESTKVTFLPNGVDTDSFQSTPSGDQPVLHEGEVGFVYAGTHGYAQGLDVIIEAARLTTDRRDIVYVFIGDGPEKLRLKELASGMQNVRFVEPRPAAAMPSVFSEMRASIVPLRDLPVFRGARPSKIFPSLACGTPVIYSGEGEAADLITSNDCGIAVPPENPEELAGAVRLLADDSAMAARLGAAGRRLVVRDYTWSSITERWLAELEATPTPAATR